MEEYLKELKKNYEFLGEPINVTLRNEELTKTLDSSYMGMTALEHVSNMLGEHKYICFLSYLYYRNEEDHIIWQVVRERSNNENT